MKKIVAILLVVALMSAMFVVPAHAHEGEEATPYAYVCARCDSTMIRYTDTEKDYYDYLGCTNNAMTHKHYDSRTYVYYYCSNCGFTTSRSLVSTTKNHCIYD